MDGIGRQHRRDGHERARERTVLYFQGLRCEADRLNIAGLTARARLDGPDPGDAVGRPDHALAAGTLEAIVPLSGWKTYSVFRRHFTADCALPPSQWRAAREGASRFPETDMNA